MPELKTVIVGTRFKGESAIAVMRKMRAGDAVVLRREPANRYDANAIACIFLDFHIGFIPAALNADLARALDLGAIAAVTVTEPGSRKGKFVTEPKISIKWDQ